jgi:hypothetical protein
MYLLREVEVQVFKIQKSFGIGIQSLQMVHGALLRPIALQRTNQKKLLERAVLDCKANSKIQTKEPVILAPVQAYGEVLGRHHQKGF